MNDTETRETIEQALQDDLDDVVLRLVYSDVLRESGDADGADRALCDAVFIVAAKRGTL
jgi:uncharacterized protein (TIGR02996 family)